MFESDWMGHLSLKRDSQGEALSSPSFQWRAQPTARQRYHLIHNFIPNAEGKFMKTMHIDEKRQCAAAGCVASIEGRAVMCDHHWEVVPPILKGKLGMASRAMRRGDMRAKSGFLKGMEAAVFEVAGVEGRGGVRR